MTSQKYSQNPSSDDLFEILSNYLTQRSAFLAKVICADLQTMSDINFCIGSVKSPIKISSNGNGKPENKKQFNGFAAESQSHETSEHRHQQAIVSTVLTQTPVQQLEKIQPPTSQPKSTPHNSHKTLDVQAILLDLIVQQTGYSPDSIESDLKLLDDLNLDSIKAGELVANAAKICGVAGEIDPSTLANASLKEIAEVIRTKMPSQKSSQAVIESITDSTSVSIQTSEVSERSKSNGSLTDQFSQLNSLSEAEIDSLLSAYMAHQ